MMQYDIDCKSKHTEHFKAIRKILLFSIDDEIDGVLLKEMIGESTVLNMEAYEMKRLRSSRWNIPKSH